MKDTNKQFEVKRKLGSGAYGNVYEVTAPGKFAIKVFDDKLSGIPELAVLLSLDDHPNIISLRKYTVKLDQTCLDSSYDFCDLGLFLELGDHDLRKMKPQDIDIKQLYTDMMAALKHVHNKNIIHGDIKPENIIWSSKEKRYKLTDFSLSEYYSPHDILQNTVCTMFYRAPEVSRKTRVCCQSDYFSLGLTLLELMNGGRPFRIEDDDEIEFAHESLYRKYPHLAIDPDRYKNKDDSYFKLRSGLAEDYIMQLLHEDPQKRLDMEPDNRTVLRMGKLIHSKDPKKKRFLDQLLGMNVSRRVFWQLIYAILYIDDDSDLRYLDLNVARQIYENIFYRETMKAKPQEVLDIVSTMKHVIVFRTPYEMGYGRTIDKRHLVSRLISNNFISSFDTF